jgi:hypothetical protein
MSVEDLPEVDFWIRIDRNLNADQRTLRRSSWEVSSSVYAANDRVSVISPESYDIEHSPGTAPVKVVVRREEKDLLVRKVSGKTVDADCSPRDRTAYEDSAQKASVREIAKLLDIFSRLSLNYVLFTVSHHLSCMTMSLPGQHHCDRKIAGIWPLSFKNSSL